MPTELELIALETEFDLYLPFSKRLVLNLPDSADRVRAAQWLQKLRSIKDDNFKKLRNEHLKLLLFALHRRSLVGIFEFKPPKEELESFHDGLTLLEMTRELIEITEAKATSGANAEDPLACPLPPVWTNLSFDLKEYSAMQNIPKFGAHCFYAISNEPIQFWRKGGQGYVDYPNTGDIPNSMQWETAFAKITDHVLEHQAEMDRRIAILKAIEKGEATEDELYPDIDFSKKIQVKVCPPMVFKWKKDSPLQLHQSYDFSDVGIAEDTESQGKEQLELDEQAFQILDSSLPGRQRVYVREPYFHQLPGDIVERRNHGVDDRIAEDEYDYALRIQMMKKICPVFLENDTHSKSGAKCPCEGKSHPQGRGYIMNNCTEEEDEEPECCRVPCQNDQEFKEQPECIDNQQSFSQQETPNTQSLSQLKSIQQQLLNQQIFLNQQRLSQQVFQNQQYMSQQICPNHQPMSQQECPNQWRQGQHEYLNQQHPYQKECPNQRHNISASCPNQQTNTAASCPNAACNSNFDKQNEPQIQFQSFDEEEDFSVLYSGNTYGDSVSSQLNNHKCQSSPPPPECDCLSSKSQTPVSNFPVCCPPPKPDNQISTTKLNTCPSMNFGFKLVTKSSTVSPPCSPPSCTPKLFSPAWGSSPAGLSPAVLTPNTLTPQSSRMKQCQSQTNCKTHPTQPCSCQITPKQSVNFQQPPEIEQYSWTPPPFNEQSTNEYQLQAESNQNCSANQLDSYQLYNLQQLQLQRSPSPYSQTQKNMNDNDDICKK